MESDPREVRDYIRAVMNTLEKHPDQLDRRTARLAIKYKETTNRLKRCFDDLNGLKNQVEQAQARIRSLELQSENIQGSANTLVEELLEERDAAESPGPPPPELLKKRPPEPAPAEEEKGEEAKGEEPKGEEPQAEEVENNNEPAESSAA